MRSLFVFALLSLGLAACVDVHNPPRQQPTSTVIVPSSPPPATTTVICPAGAIAC